MTIVLAEDHTLLRSGLRMILETENSFTIVAEAANGMEVLHLLETNKPIDLVLADINMPILDGIELTREIVHRGYPTKVVILSMHGSDAYVQESFKVGVWGYLLKTVGAVELIYALQLVYAGVKYICAELSFNFLQRNLPFAEAGAQTDLLAMDFSSRELEVLTLIAAGLTNHQMSEKLFLSKRTIEGHRQSLIQKAGVNNTAALVGWAMRNKLIH